MHRFIFLLFVVFMMSCSKDENHFGTNLYINHFDNPADLSDFEIGFGDIKIVNDESAEETAGSLNVFGWCLVPNLKIELGPFEKDYDVILESWIKTQYGAALHLNLESDPQDYVRIETKEDLFKAREWNLYKSEPLTVLKGDLLQLYVDASNNTLSHTWIDELKILAKEH